MRQPGNMQFFVILNALRVEELKSEPIEVIPSNVSNETSVMFSLEMALRIYLTNEQVNNNRFVPEHFRKKG